MRPFGRRSHVKIVNPWRWWLDQLDEGGTTGFVVFAVVLLMVASTISLATVWCYNTFYDNVPSLVVVDGMTVYEGPSCGYKVESRGAASEVTIYGGLLYLFPKKVYVSENVEVNPLRTQHDESRIPIGAEHPEEAR